MIKLPENNAVEVKAEIEDSDEGYRFRLVCGSEVSPWSRWYQGLVVHKFKDGRTFGLASAYWETMLPIEVPFEIVVHAKPEEVVSDPESTLLTSVDKNGERYLMVI